MIKEINLEEILISTPVKYFDWWRMKGNTPEVYNAILNAMKEACNQTVDLCAENATCESDGDYLIPEIDKNSILKLKIK